MRREAKKLPFLQSMGVVTIPLILFFGLVFVMTLITDSNQNSTLEIVGISLIPMVTALALGYLFAKKTFISAFSSGIVSGFALMLVMIIIGGFLFGELPGLLHIALLAGKVIPAAILGAVFGVSGRPRKRK